MEWAKSSHTDLFLFCFVSCCFFENGLGEALIGWAWLFAFTMKLLLLCLEEESKLKVHLSKSEIVPMGEFEDIHIFGKYPMLFLQ